MISVTAVAPRPLWHDIYLEFNFSNSEIFCDFLEFLVFWVSCQLGFFTTFGTNLQIFTKPI